MFAPVPCPDVSFPSFLPLPPVSCRSPWEWLDHSVASSTVVCLQLNNSRHRPALGCRECPRLTPNSSGHHCTGLLWMWPSWPWSQKFHSPAVGVYSNHWNLWRTGSKRNSQPSSLRCRFHSWWSGIHFMILPHWLIFGMSWWFRYYSRIKMHW